MSDVKPIDLLEYSVDMNSYPLEAAESQVYKGIDKDGKPIAVKIYKDMPMEQVLLYQKITNDLAKEHNNNEYLKIEFDGESHDLLIYIVPIQEVHLAGSRPCTFSPFIEGPTLFNIEPHYISSRFNKLKDDPLVRLGKNFRDETGYDNISIIPWNVKPLLNEHPKRLAITDITGSVKDLRIMV
jgi:hypothetical protein